MSRALIVTTDGNPLKFNFWCKNYDRFIVGEVDKVYVTMFSHLGCELKKAFKELCEARNFQLLTSEGEGMGRQILQLSAATEAVQEDYVVYLEDDMWVTERDVIGSRFRKLESNECRAIASPRYDSDHFGDLNAICELAKTEEANDLFRKYYLWHSWLFVHTKDIKKCIEDFVRVVSEHNFIHNNMVSPLSKSVNPHWKRYQTFIPDYRFWGGMYDVGAKLPLIHSDWVFLQQCTDEVFLIGSFLLLKQIGVPNFQFEEQINIISNSINYFDVKTKIEKVWSRKFVHSMGSSGYDGCYGFVHNEYYQPILYPITYSTFLAEPESYPKWEKSCGFRLAMNLAFCAAYDKPNIQEFLGDYKKYLLYHANPDCLDDAMHMRDMLSKKLI